MIHLCLCPAFSFPLLNKALINLFKWHFKNTLSRHYSYTFPGAGCPRQVYHISANMAGAFTCLFVFPVFLTIWRCFQWPNSFRKHWRTLRTSDKLKGQLKGCPLNMPGILLEGLSLLRNPARMTSTGTLVTSWIRSLIHWHTRINSTLGIRLFFRKSKANIL